MKKIENGVFEIVLGPTSEGVPVIAHNSKVKVVLEAKN